MYTKRDALDEIDAKKEVLEDLSDCIWDHPETKFRESYATEHIIEVLKAEGFEVETDLAGIETAFSGSYGKGHPVIGILGEYDALPGMSQKAGVTEKDPVTEGAPGHGCGHNLLGVGSLAAAIAVKEYLKATGKEGTIKFLGCPAEEGGAGKGFMARDGVFDDLDMAFSWHPGELNAVAMSSTNANYQIAYHFYGLSSHAGMAPELGRSALDAVELMNTGVQYLREHIPSDNRIHYAITDAGGVSPGVVQSYAEVLYLMRAPKLDAVRELCERVNRIAQGAALMTDTRVEIEFIKATSNTLIIESLAKVMYKNLKEVELPKYTREEIGYAEAIKATVQFKDHYFEELAEAVEDPEEKAALLENKDAALHDVVMPMASEGSSFASSDVGDVSQVCPVAQVTACTMASGTPMHSWQTVTVGKSSFAKKGMLYAGKVMAGSAIDAIEDPEILKAAKAEFEEKTGGKRYVSPIPKDVKPKF